MAEESKPDTKVLIRLTNDTETLWATSLGDYLYRLENTPFFAYDVSYEDIVLALPIAESDVVEFQHIVSKSGNKTIRVIFEIPLGDGGVPDQINHSLNSLNCFYEGCNPKYVCYNIPADVKLEQVTSLLRGQPLNWEYADPSYDTLFPAQPEPPSKERKKWWKPLAK